MLHSSLYWIIGLHWIYHDQIVRNNTNNNTTTTTNSYSSHRNEKKNQTKQKQPNDKTFTIAVSALNINIVESFFRNVIFRKSTAYRWLWAHLHIHYFVFIWFIFCGVVRICQRIEKGPTLYIYLMHAIVWFYFQNFRSLSRIKNKAQLNRAPLSKQQQR